MPTIQPGDRVLIRTAVGDSLVRRALSEPMPGSHDFLIVWVCREEEWREAHAEGREPTGVPWPAEDVQRLDERAA
jgi:hypothetical protein